MMRGFLALIAAGLLSAGACLAQPAPAAPPAGAPMPPGGSMPGMHGMPPAGQPGEPGYEQGYRDSMAKMHHDMDIPFTGNADRDFVAGMIPHHQGAIDMAQIELRYGHDPQLRRLAQDIIRAQHKEIAFMRQWQAKHAH